ncbi:uncharacterized protein MELLADRAFT_115692 [Melampsora larici-populina 98AG31]|uniref:Uncharacterized protein n=1 Tax=Melampsora larici-populina (strain 98AG31 / pathotype 3-4-7) TaxID=747676 RepID=F4RD27_MELLP|nr:uncharacterized protein MELLADRAFT_115692 [Melampsora larici-populina 98AG31]EGG09826.1 hypothetical protein MELLADRAFT_115692 [Melampsora larici-populina 98AG31]
MENQPILITSHTSFHSSHLPTYTTHQNQKRQRSSSPIEDQRYIKQRSDSNFVSQPPTPTLLDVSDEIQTRSWTGTPSNTSPRLTFEPSSIFNQTHQDVQMECEDDAHSTDTFNMNDSNPIGWSPRSVHTLRRVSTPSETPIPTTFTLPITATTMPHPRPQPLHRPHPMAYQQHLALLSQPKPISQDPSQMSISPPQSPSRLQPFPSDLILQPAERPQRPKNPINYILGPKKGCEDCRKKVAGHYTHL